MNSPLAQVAQLLRETRVGLHADNLSAAYKSRANVLLIDDAGEYVADYFLPTDRETPEQIARRIAGKLHDGRNRLRIAQVAVIPSGARTSRIVDVDDPREVGFSTQFTAGAARPGF